MDIVKALKKCKNNACYTLEELNMRKGMKNWSHGIDRSKNPTINSIIDWCNICGYEVVIRRKNMHNDSMVIDKKVKR